MLRALAILLAAGAMACMLMAIAGMVTQRQGARTGYLLRVGAVACFAAAVALNAAAH